MKNQVSLIGRVGQDPEHGNNFARISVATSKKWKDQQGKQQEKTEWHRCVGFRKTAEIVADYVRKGDLLGIEGEIQYGSYEKDGVKHYTTDIIIHRLILLSPKGQGGSRGGGQQQKAGTGRPSYNNDYTSEDIPF